MTISKKPKKADVSEAVINAIIEKGGSVGVAENKQDSGKKNLQLRLESDLIDQIDKVRGKRTIPPSRHTWILEAIYEKLQNESLNS
jgi:hypothetical protein